MIKIKTINKPILAQPIDPMLVDTITNIFIFVDLQIKINLEIIEFEERTHEISQCRPEKCGDKQEQI
jgi:hypothetical protein